MSEGFADLNLNKHDTQLDDEADMQEHTQGKVQSLESGSQSLEKGFQSLEKDSHSKLVNQSMHQHLKALKRFLENQNHGLKGINPDMHHHIQLITLFLILMLVLKLDPS